MNYRLITKDCHDTSYNRTYLETCCYVVTVQIFCLIIAFSLKLERFLWILVANIKKTAFYLSCDRFCRERKAVNSFAQAANKKTILGFFADSSRALVLVGCRVGLVLNWVWNILQSFSGTRLYPAERSSSSRWPEGWCRVGAQKVSVDLRSSRSENSGGAAAGTLIKPLLRFHNQNLVACVCDYKIWYHKKKKKKLQARLIMLLLKRYHVAVSGRSLPHCSNFTLIC